MKHVFPLLLLSTFLFSAEEFNIEDDFLQSLEDVSEIATKTKLNIDDAPSFITVLHRTKLQKLGIDNVFEALAQVPGVQIKREASGVPVVIFRGVSQKGEVKLMLDGVSINNTYRGSIYYILDLPIELVERIEVIRGAGSVLYGSGAISGVINIITKSAEGTGENTLFVSGGTYDYYKGGAIVSSKVGNVNIALDTYYQTQDKIVDSVDRHLEDYSVGLKISDEHFALLARVKKSVDGNAYGVLGVADRDRDRYDNDNTTFFTQLAYKNSLGKDSEIEFLAGYNQYTQNIATRHAAFGDLNTEYSENAYYAQADLYSKSIANNELLVGIKYESAKVLQSQVYWKNPQSFLPKYFAEPNSKRDTASIYLNDKYSVTSDLDIATGLRYDNYSDFGDAVSPTISLVYRLTAKWRIKALYAKAFRAPSWIELTSNNNLKAETSNSFEAGLVYKRNQNSVLRLNTYQTIIDDLIIKNGTYIQSEYASFTGAELEYIFTPINELELNLFASYVQAKDSNGEDLADVANTLITASSVYELDSGISIGGLLKYVGSSKRSSNDIRESMPSSLIVDTTVSYSYKKITGSLVIKDLFDKGTYYSLPTSTTNNDFYDFGRTVLVKIAWEL